MEKAKLIKKLTESIGDVSGVENFVNHTMNRYKR